MSLSVTLEVASAPAIAVFGKGEHHAGNPPLAKEQLSKHASSKNCITPTLDTRAEVLRTRRVNPSPCKEKKASLAASLKGCSAFAPVRNRTESLAGLHDDHPGLRRSSWTARRHHRC